MTRPKKLYKYRSLAGKSLDRIKCILTCNKIYLSTIDINNDPFEGRFSATRHTGTIDGDFGIFAMSEVNNDVLMWAHYADSYKGICIEFDTASVESILSKAEKVRYIDNYAEISRLDDLRGNPFKIAILSKATNWEYEKEWRVIGPKGDNVLPIGVISGVILGCKISGENAYCVAKWVEKYNTKNIDKQITLYGLTSIGDKFELSVNKL